MTPTTPGSLGFFGGVSFDDRERFVDQQSVGSDEAGLTVERPSPQEDRDRVLRRHAGNRRRGLCGRAFSSHFSILDHPQARPGL